MLVALISDTHGLLRDEALAWLRGSGRILHAGDVGDAAVLDALRRVAPVAAVRGNNDRGPWALELPANVTLELGPVSVHMVHDIADLAVDPVAAGIAVVVHGHSHRPGQERRDGVLYVNPGSAGPRRFRLPISLARLRIARGRVAVEFRTLG